MVTKPATTIQIVENKVPKVRDVRTLLLQCGPSEFFRELQQVSKYGMYYTCWRPPTSRPWNLNVHFTLISHSRPQPPKKLPR